MSASSPGDRHRDFVLCTELLLDLIELELQIRLILLLLLSLLLVSVLRSLLVRSLVGFCWGILRLRESDFGSDVRWPMYDWTVLFKTYLAAIFCASSRFLALMLTTARNSPPSCQPDMNESPKSRAVAAV